MKPMTVLSAAEQVAAHVREEIRQQRLRGSLPGAMSLAKALSVNHKTVKSALRILEHEGWLVSQGRGFHRTIVPRLENGHATPLRVGLLLNERADQMNGTIVELHHQLAAAGHIPMHLPKSLREIGTNTGRLARLIDRNPADAWVVVEGSNEIMRWFIENSRQAFALYGRQRALTVSGCRIDKERAIAEATRTLIRLGHRRIVLLASKARRLPQPGANEQAFLDELKAHGIATSAYHLPDWEMTVDGFYDCLRTAFQFTRPTALIIHDASLYVAVQQFLTERKLRVPQDISLLCANPDPVFDWCKSSVAHIDWDSRMIIRRVLTWAGQVRMGSEKPKQSVIPARFVIGDTIKRVNVRGTTHDP